MAGGTARQAWASVHRVYAGRSAPIVLELDLTVDPTEGVPADPVAAALTRRRPSLRAIVDGLRRTGNDGRASTLIARIAPCGMPLARAQEIRDAVIAFRHAGGTAFAYSDAFGEFGGGTVPYYLASAFDEIWLAPPGDLGITGVALETPFLRDALDRLGIEIQVGQRHEYKNAVNMFVERDFTAAHLEASGRIVASSLAMIIDGIATGRDLPPDRVRDLIDNAPLSGEQAVRAGLVDRLGYRDEVYAAARAHARRTVPDAGEGEGGTLVYLSHYRRASVRREASRLRVATLSARGPARSQRRRVIAVIHGTGPVVLGRPGRSPLAGPAMTSDALTAAFRAAGRDDDVAAVVFRVDSPGGSYVASDLIRREVERFQASGRPVVVSMGSVAASGGYFVALGADAIVANPGTLTGSIGVFGGKQVVRELLDKMGVRFGAVAEGENALMTSPQRAFSPSERAKLEEFLDRVYDDFVAKVAAGRGMSSEAVHEVARGRVWTGADARDRGLVDELGGFSRACELAWEKVGRPGSDTPRLRLLPKVGLADRLRSPRSSEDPAAAAVGMAGMSGIAGIASMAGVLGGAAFTGGWGPLATAAARAGLPLGGPLLMPPIGQVT
ncbi:signal peptide peptidase SppA [Frankia sp. Cas4]|uniref:signal peptide peptidase SppA n=1 Tax=Frankia sp. Cas4 TaxID=3073927 RepID=UPI002AD38280|nr:signal peptide peptidase SppA [Frankia sp. Cas4]